VTETDFVYTSATTVSAAMSSTMTSVSRKGRTLGAHGPPTSASVPSAKAVSVAIGIAQPCVVGVPALNAR
jgi:hypothetical protein